MPEEDDHSDNLLNTDATPLAFDPIGRRVIGRDGGIIGFFETPNERDVFKFTIESDARVIVDVRGTSTLFDSFVEVYNIDGTLVGSNDNNSNPAVPNNSDSQLILTNLRDGEYFVVVSGANESIGSYRVSVRHNGAVGGVDDHGDSFGGATRFPLVAAPDTTHISAIAELGNDRDMFLFTSNITGRLIVRSNAVTGDLNTVLRGYDADRNLLEANNNFNGSLNSRIELDVVEGEDYFVRLSSVGDTTGIYRISLRPLGESSGGGATGAGFVDSNVNLDFDGGGSELVGSNSSPVEDFSRIDNFGDLSNGIIA